MKDTYIEMSSQKLKIYFSIHNNENMLRQIQVQAPPSPYTSRVQ